MIIIKIYYKNCMQLAKAWTAIDRLSSKWKSDLSDKIKHNFFQTAVVSILLYGCTRWMLTKCMKKKAKQELHKNATRYIEQILETTSLKPSLKPSKEVRQDM